MYTIRVVKLFTLIRQKHQIMYCYANRNTHGGGFVFFMAFDC